LVLLQIFNQCNMKRAQVGKYLSATDVSKTGKSGSF